MPNLVIFPGTVDYNPVPTNDFPSWPNEETATPYHPWLPAGVDNTAVACDEINGYGINWTREVWGWDDIKLSRPTAMAAAGNADPEVPSDDGQTVDIWINREKRFVMLARDWTKTRAAGRRGHIDEG